jgi:hypothetical protein
VGSHWRTGYKIILLIFWSRGMSTLNKNIGLDFVGSRRRGRMKQTSKMTVLEEEEKCDKT